MKWEYLILNDLGEFTSEIYKLGQEGWELVTVNMGFGVHPMFVFKRPLK